MHEKKKERRRKLKWSHKRSHETSGQMQVMWFVLNQAAGLEFLEDVFHPRLHWRPTWHRTAKWVYITCDSHNSYLTFYPLLPCLCQRWWGFMATSRWSCLHFLEEGIHKSLSQENVGFVRVTFLPQHEAAATCWICSISTFHLQGLHNHHNSNMKHVDHNHHVIILVQMKVVMKSL